MENGFLQDSERTILEVFDKKNGVFIQSDDFFKQPEDVIIRWRRYLEECALMNEPRLVCSHCNQMVKLSGRKTERGRVVFFSHLYNSEDCDIKTGNDRTKEEILAEKYGKITESERHFRLKNLISQYLTTDVSLSLGISDVEVEKRIQSNVPYLNWRRPDVSAVYKGMNIVFELQLSTTFLSVVVDRDIFYRLNNHFIIWVFNFDENQEYVNLKNLMMKDIYYANKRNIFVFDEDAQDKSEEEGTLYLHCMWIQEDGKFCEGELVSLNDLSFEKEQCKPYYIDADELFYKLHPERKGLIKELERSRKSIIEALMRRISANEMKERRLQEKALILEEKMKTLGVLATPYTSFEKWGFKFDDEIVTQAQFESIEQVDSGDYIVKKEALEGLVNKFGRLIIDCVYKKIIPIFDNVVLVLEKTNWKLLNKGQFIASYRRLDSYKLENLNDNSKLLVFQDGRKKPEPDKKFLFFRNGTYIEVKEIKTEGSILMCKGIGDWKFNEITPSGLIVYKRNYNTIIAKTGESKYGLLDDSYKMQTSISYDSMEYQSESYLKVSTENNFGIISFDENILFDIKYKDIGQLGNNLFKLKEQGNSYWDIVNGKGELYFSTKGDLAYSISDFGNLIGEFLLYKYVVGYEAKYGLIDLKGHILIKAEYSSIEEWDKDNGIIKVRTHWNNKEYYGFLKANLDVLFPCTLEELNVQNDGYILSRDNQYVYIFNHEIDILFKAKGDRIVSYTSQYVYVKTIDNKYDRWSKSYILVYTFEQNPTLKTNERFHSIDNFIDGFANITVYREDGLIKEGIVNREFEPILCDEQKLSNGFVKGTLFGRWGVKNDKEQIIIPYKYMDIVESGSHFIVYRGEKSLNVGGRPHYYKGELDESGNFIPEEFVLLPNSLYKVKFQGLYGICDAEKNIIVPIKYKEIDYLTDSLYKVIKNNEIFYYIIDNEGNELIDSPYNSISFMENGYIKFTNIRSWGMNPAGIGGFISPDGKICVYGKFEGDSFDGNKLLMKRRYGASYVTEYGEIISDEEILFSNGWIRFKQFGLYGLKDNNGKILLPCKYNTILFCEDKDYIITNENSCYVNGVTRILDKELGVIKELEEGKKIISYFGDGLFKVINTEKQLGVLNDNWKLIISYRYHNIEYHNGFFIVSELKEIGRRFSRQQIPIYGVYTKDGECFAFCRYTKVELIGSKFWKVWENNQYKIVFPPNKILLFDDIWELTKEYYKVKKKGKVGVLNLEIKSIVPTQYDDVRITNNRIEVLDGHSWIDYETKEIVEVIQSFKEGLIYQGEVCKIKNYGIFVRVSNLGTGLIHISELRKHKQSIGNFTMGQQLNVKVISTTNNRIGFTIDD